MAHWKSTPSHGYLYLSKSEQARMPEYMRMRRYEEDCDWALAYMVMPEIAYQPHIMKHAAHSPEDDIDLAYKIARWDHPHFYQMFTGIDTTQDTGRMMDNLRNRTKFGEWLRANKAGWYEHTMDNPAPAIKVWDEWLERFDQANQEPAELEPAPLPRRILGTLRRFSRAMLPA